MIKYRYGYILAITDNDGTVIKYDHLLTNEILLYSSSIYTNLSGIILLRYNLYNEHERACFFKAIDTYIVSSNAENINILFELSCNLQNL